MLTRKVLEQLDETKFVIFLYDHAISAYNMLPKASKTELLNEVERVQAIKTCFQRNIPTPVEEKKEHVNLLQQTFLAKSLDLHKIKSVLVAIENDELFLKQVKALLQEPALQHLARRAGQQDNYERLIFGDW